MIGLKQNPEAGEKTSLDFHQTIEDRRLLVKLESHINRFQFEEAKEVLGQAAKEIKAQPPIPASVNHQTRRRHAFSTT